MTSSCVVSCVGLSPRTRGSPCGRGGQATRVGSIPADAGEPPCATRPRTCLRVYPRGCGGAALASALATWSDGLSPRTRGSRRGEIGDRLRVGSIPADAGEPGGNGGGSDRLGVYPRGRGGAVSPALPMAEYRGLSPRTRGSLQGDRKRHGGMGSIPADAGEPRPRNRTPCWGRVYPRGRGGAVQRIANENGQEGLSPRTRGSRLLWP